MSCSVQQSKQLPSRLDARRGGCSINVGLTVLKHGALLELALQHKSEIPPQLQQS